MATRYDRSAYSSFQRYASLLPSFSISINEFGAWVKDGWIFDAGVILEVSKMLLHEAAKVVRSKNAGPRLFTFDIMFANSGNFERACNRLPGHADTIAELYGVKPDDVRIILYAPANAIKIVIPRRFMSGDRQDSDVYGAQQHAPLLDLPI